MHALTLALLAAALGLYAWGVRRLWRKAGAGRGIRYPHLACFLLGWLVVAGALLSELHHYAERLLWAHMVQHEVAALVLISRWLRPRGLPP